MTTRPLPAPAHRHWLFLVVVACGLAASLGQAARAQGTAGTLPDPITTRQLTGYADRLGLSRSQRSAIESIHDDYKRDFQALRQGEIAEFLESMHGMQSGGMPRRERVEEFLEKMEELLAKVKIKDDRLFDRITPLLSEQQATMLPRVRLARERVRYEAQQMMSMMGRPVVDLSKVFIELDLPPEEAAAADSIIALYERQLTVKMRDMSKAARYMTLDMMDAIEELGFGEATEEDMADPEMMTKMMEAMRTAFQEITKRSNEIASDLRKLNHATYRSVAGTLPNRDAVRFRTGYYHRAYNELEGILRLAEENVAQQASDHGDVLEGGLTGELTGEQREAIESMAVAYRSRFDRWLEDGVKLVDKQRDGFSPFDFDQEGQRDTRDALRKIQTEASEFHRAEQERLTQLLGDEAMKAIRIAAARAAGDETAGSTAGHDGPEEDGASDETEEAFWAGDQFTPAPIARTEVRHMADRLELDDGLRRVLFDLHEGYLEEYRALAELEDVRAANRELWKYDPDSGETTPPDDQAIEALYRLRAKALVAIQTLDASFFDDVELAVTDGAIARPADRMRRNRQRQTYTGNARAPYAFGWGRSNEAGIDLVALAGAQRLDEAEAIRIDTVLATYEAESLDLLRARYEAQIALQEASDRWNIAAQRNRGDDIADRMDYAQRYREIVGPASESAIAASQTVAELNRKSLDALIERLSPDSGRRLRRAYRRQAFPSVFEDAGAAEDAMTAALAMDDLTAEQGEQLREFAAAYRPEYERMSTALSEIVVAQGEVNPTNTDREYWREYQKRQEQLEQIQFERNELNDRARSRLRSVLTEDQARRLPSLRSDG